MNQIALILEWENALVQELDRAVEMLRRLDRQVRDYAHEHGVGIDLLVVFNSDIVDERIPRDCLTDVLDCDSWPGSIDFLDVPGAHYYELKNAGAKHTQAPIFVFIDSDVIPEANWLASLLDAVQAPGATMVAGCASLGGETLTDKMFAAFWVFPPRRPFDGLKTRHHFWANNIAFRRDVFLSNPFPAANCYRGQCTELARAHDRKIPTHGRAWVEHPAPNGLTHIFQRAIAKGYDQVYWSSRRGDDRTGPLGAFVRFKKNAARVFKKVNGRSGLLKLSRAQIGLSYAAGVTYFFVVMLGEFVALVSPEFIRERVPSV